MRKTIERVIASFLLVYCGVFVGCGNSDDEVVPVYSVSGKVSHNDQPMVGAIVIFHPQQSALFQGTPRATADEQGHYQLSTFNENDGAPIGEYKVTIYWPEGGIAPEDADPLPPDQLNNAYSNAEATTLTATVRDSDNQLNFDLPPH